MSREVTDEEIIVVHRTTEYRGDHSAEVAYYYAPLNGETIAQVVARLNVHPPDYIEVHMRWRKS